MSSNLYNKSKFSTCLQNVLFFESLGPLYLYNTLNCEVSCNEPSSGFESLRFTANSAYSELLNSSSVISTHPLSSLSSCVLPTDFNDLSNCAFSSSVKLSKCFSE